MDRFEKARMTCENIAKRFFMQIIQIISVIFKKLFKLLSLKGHFYFVSRDVSSCFLRILFKVSVYFSVSWNFEAFNPCLKVIYVIYGQKIEI